MTLWSGRFEGDPDATIFDFQSSFNVDRRLFQDDVTGSLAWAEALVHAGVLSASDGLAIARALTEILEEGRRNPSFVAGPDEDVHSFVERQLVERIGDTGKRLHTGRSRNEQVSLDLRMYVKRRIPVLHSRLTRLVGALADGAASAADAIMPAYTHLRRAQPVLVGHWYLAHASALRRAHERLTGVIDEANALPLGSGAVAGSGYAVDIPRLASRLGFARVTRNSIDTSSNRDFVAAFLFAVALGTVQLSRLAEDLILFTAEEFGFFELADTVATGSSLLPQKKNPDPLELVRGKTGRVIAHLTGWLTTMKGLPSGYSKDLQEDKEAVFDAEDTFDACVTAMTIVVGSLRLNRATSAQAAGGFLLATDVADYLVSRGVPFREAHELVGRMVRIMLMENRDFGSLSEVEWRGWHPLFDADIVKHLNPSASVAARRTPQSTSPAAVAAALEDLRAWLGRQRVPESVTRNET
jgi:argininosuccinate lyase